MKTNINITNSFSRQAKRLIKKYKSLKNELQELELKLINNPKLGVSIGNNSFKIRLAVKSKGKGKRGGIRIITYLDIIIYKDEVVNDLFLLSIYDKSQLSNISEKEISTLINQIRNG